MARLATCVTVLAMAFLGVSREVSAHQPKNPKSALFSRAWLHFRHSYSGIKKHGENCRKNRGARVSRHQGDDDPRSGVGAEPVGCYGNHYKGQQSPIAECCRP